MTTPLGLGTNKVGGHNLFKNLKDNDGREVIKAALDAGVTMLDTAFMYGLGRSEEIIGEVIADYQRSEIVIATKGAHDSTNDFRPNNQPAFLKQQVEASLKRLKTDYLDIFYIHFPDEGTPKAEAIGALHELKEAGKIRAIGISNFSLDQIKEANQDGYVDIVEDQYSLLHREAESDIFPYLRDNKISFVPYFPLVSGLLSGKYSINDKFSGEDWRADKADFQGARFVNTMQKMEQVEKIANDYGVTPTQLILAWYINNPNISVVIPGARNKVQVLQNMQAINIDLKPEDYEVINQLFK